MQPPQRLAHAALWAVSVCLTAGCGSGVYVEIESFATPTSALESGNADLVAEIEAIQAAGGLSEQLARPLRAEPSNAAFALAESYSDALHVRLTPIVEELLVPGSDASRREAFVKTNEQLINKTASAADLAECRFAVGHRYGFFARMSYLDDARQASQLLQLRAKHRGATGDRAAALSDLIRSLRVVRWLSEVRRIEARVLAATLRSDTLELAARMIEAGELRRFECEQLYGALRDQLADWPADSRALVGERATVVHSYEAIRAGMLDKLITLEERDELSQAGHLQRMREASAATVNDDEVAYLQMAKRVIDAADEPYAARQEALGIALSELSESPSLFARTLFVEDLPDAIWYATADRALVEAWTVALASSAGLRLPPFRESPLNGEPYRVERDERRVTVDYGEASDRQVTLPVMARL